jgi:hypothetical protein
MMRDLKAKVEKMTKEISIPQFLVSWIYTLTPLGRVTDLVVN